MPPIRRPADDHFDDFEPIEPTPKPPADPLDDFALIDPIDAPAARRPRPRPVERRPRAAMDFDDFEPRKSRLGLYVGLGVGASVLLAGAVAAILLVGDSLGNPPATSISTKATMMAKDEFPGFRPPVQPWDKIAPATPKPEIPNTKFDPGTLVPEMPKFDPNLKVPESPKSEPVAKAVPRLRETPTSFRMRPGSHMGARILWTQVPESKVRYEIRKAPPGVTVDSGGSVDWKIPENVERIEHEIVVAISVEDPKMELLWVRKFDLRDAAPVAANPNPSKDLPPGSPPAFLKVKLDKLPAYDGGPIESIDLKLTEGSLLNSATIGAGGRYLFVSTTAASEIRMYDLSTRKAAKPIPYRAGRTIGVRVAAGANVLVAYDPATGVLTSWKLDSLDSPKEMTIPKSGNHQLILGAESNGPLFVRNGTGTLPSFWTVDPVTLIPVRYDRGDDEQTADSLRSPPSAIDPTGTTIVTRGYLDR